MGNHTITFTAIDSNLLATSDSIVLQIVPDEDRDGIPDFWERNFSVMDTLKDDSRADPDSDNLMNIDEFLFKTIPENPDTDGDSFLDGYEIFNGSDPNDPESIPTNISFQTPNSLIPKNYSISQNYPNPFNPLTKINYQLPINTFVKIEIFNILGQKVETLVNSEHLAGSYFVTWDASRYSSGIYFYTIRTKGYYKSKKMLLIK